MSENAMEALAELVQPCASGKRLLGALRSANLPGADIPKLIADVISEKLAAAGPGGGATGSGRVSLEGALCVIDGLMFLNPRGKQQLALFPDKCLVRTAKADIWVPWGAIKHVAIIDSIPGDTKGKVLLYLHIESVEIMNGKSSLTAIVVQTTAEAQLDIEHPKGGGRLQGAAAVVLCQALGAVPGGVDPACFVSPDAQYFQSAAKAAGVTAYVKARQGFLYPLPSALCFLEAPALYLPHAAIRSVELMRVGGSSFTFDMVLHLHSGAVHEFGMVPREEVTGIEDYIRKCRLAVGAGETSDEDGERASGSAEAEAEESDDDSEDQDFNPTSSSDDEEEAQEQGEGGQQQQQLAGSSSGKRKRAASSEEGGDTVAVSSCGQEGGQEEEEDEEEKSEEESSSEEDETSNDDGSMELVSDDDFSRGALKGLIAEESSGDGRAKRQRV